MTPIASELKKTISRCLGYVNRYGDGLSVDHLSSLLPKTPRPLLSKALAYLVQNEMVIHANDDWYYSMEEPKHIEIPRPAPSSDSFQFKKDQALMSDKPLPTIIRLRNWFEQRDPSSPPILLKDLSDLLVADRETITKALRKLLEILSAEQAAQLDAAIIRRKVKHKPPEPTSEPEAEPEPASEPEPESKTNQSSDDWVHEFRSHLIAKRIPEHASQWQETLRNMDRVFAELGVPDSQRARKHVQEMIEWLTI